MNPFYQLDSPLRETTTKGDTGEHSGDIQGSKIDIEFVGDEGFSYWITGYWIIYWDIGRDINQYQAYRIGKPSKMILHYRYLE